MNTEVQLEERIADIEVPNACIACDGPLAVRLSAHAARGFCRACHAVLALGLARSPDGLQLAPVPRADA